jgi:ornithine decarboxylase
MNMNHSLSFDISNLPSLMETHLKVNEEENAFIVIYLEDLRKKYFHWKNSLERVLPYYAVKCNPDPKILEELNKLGAGFDCASLGEIELVLSLGISSDKLLFAHPMKSISHIRKAKEYGVGLTVVDSKEEMRKMKQHYPGCKILVRMVTDDSFSLCHLSNKFGATFDECVELFDLAKELNMPLIGLSFHVGSGCYSTQSYRNALSSAKSLFEIARDQFGLEFSHLDIGGGMPGRLDFDPPFEAFSSTISETIDDLFHGVDIIAEPGRYFAETCVVGVTQVVGKRKRYVDELKEDFTYSYFINDSIYGGFNAILYDHAQFTPIPLNPKYIGQTQYASTIYGQTCDGLDTIIENLFLPSLEIGEWIYWTHFGAYTSAAGSSFNGFNRPSVYYVH